MNARFLLLLPLVVMMSCGHVQEEQNSSPEHNSIATGAWLLSLELREDIELPVNIRVLNDSSILFINGEERIASSIEYLGSDSIRIVMPFFDSYFMGILEGEGAILNGLWFNRAKSQDYSIPFHATASSEPRFCSSGLPESLLNRYKVVFSPDSLEDLYPAVGIFQTHSNGSVTGTFATETGDYRYLEGQVCNGELWLSCFDGSHAFLFSAEIDKDSLTNGRFYSGNHWEEPWIGRADQEFSLRDPYSLTQVVDSSALMSTRFIMEDGSHKALSELISPNEVTILQVMGSWCPNCLDESLFYKELYETYADMGLNILPISFETSGDVTLAYEAIHRLERDMDLPYPIYYGGKRSKSSASEAIPALNHIMSYPTSIFLDRNGEVRVVHTGYYGPSTGMYYDRYVTMTHGLIKDLLSDKG